MKVKFIFTLLPLIFFMILSTPCLSWASKNPENIICPNPKLFKSIPFDEVLKGDTQGVWTLVQKNQSYNTPIHWEFSLIVEADSKEEALKKAKLALAHLRKIRGPEKSEGAWVCGYASKYSMMATTSSMP